MADVFYSPSTAGEFRQGEILTGLKQIVPLPGTALQSPVANIVEHRYAVILSQDCDLEQDFKARFDPDLDPSKLAAKERRKLQSILFCDAIPEAEVKERIADPSIWRNALQNKNEPFHYLHEASQEGDAKGEGLPPLGLDFKNYFTMATDDVYAQANALKNRRSVLKAYYAEHLSVRFFFYQLRIALPKEH